MRPLVRSEQIKLRMPKSVKHMIVTRSQELGLTQTGYIERLIKADYGVRKVEKELANMGIGEYANERPLCPADISPEGENRALAQEGQVKVEGE